MSPSIQLNLPPSPLNRVGIASPTLPKSLGDWRALVAQAFGKAGLTQKEAASRLDVTQSALSKQLAGVEHLSFWRMFSLGRDFWLEAIPLIAEFHGISIGTSPLDEEHRKIGKAYCELQQQVVRTVTR